VRRGDLYRVFKGSKSNPKKSRVFVVISRPILIDSNFSTVICAPIYSAYNGLSTQVLVGQTEGLKHESSIHCDELISIQKSALTDFVGRVAYDKMPELNRALAVAVGID